MHNSMDLDTKNNCTKFKSLDKCLNTSMTSLQTYLKSHPNKRHKIEPVTLIPITFVELKVKQENDTFATLRTLLDSGASSTLITAKAVRHLKKLHEKKTVSAVYQGIFLPMVNATYASKWLNSTQRPRSATALT